jgi:hypothetical protein
LFKGNQIKAAFQHDAAYMNNLVDLDYSRVGELRYIRGFARFHAFQAAMQHRERLSDENIR